MAKEITAKIKLQVPAGKANPAPPVGPALGQHGVNIMEFCKAFNAQTQQIEKGLPIPVVITVYSDRSFTFVTKTPPASVLLMKALGIPKGSSTPNTTKVGTVSRAQLEEIVPGQLDLGPEVAWKIVGVIADEKIGSLGEPGNVGMYVSSRQSPVYANNLVVRADLPPEVLHRSIRAAIDRIDKSQPLSNVRTLEQIETQSLGSQKLQSTLLGIFAVLALLLASIGIYGVLSYTVAQRTREMGLRAALGARAGDLLGLVLAGGMRLVAMGLGIGLVTALASTHLMSSMLFGVGARDPLTLVVVGVVLGGVGVLACFVPARRIVAIDPNAALRDQ